MSKFKDEDIDYIIEHLYERFKKAGTEENDDLIIKYSHEIRDWVKMKGIEVKDEKDLVTLFEELSNKISGKVEKKTMKVVTFED